MKHPPSGDPQERLAVLHDMVVTYSRRLDLISPRDLPRLYERHIEDSLRALPLVLAARPGPCVDVGSGAGFPGIPLAIASGRHWRLIEPRARRAAFLEEVVRELDLERCEVLPVTAEQAALRPGVGASHVLAIARALAPPPEALDICAPLVAPGGTIALFVGANTEIPPEAEETAPGLITIVKDGG